MNYHEVNKPTTNESNLLSNTHGMTSTEVISLQGKTIATEVVTHSAVTAKVTKWNLTLLCPLLTILAFSQMNENRAHLFRGIM